MNAHTPLSPYGSRRWETRCDRHSHKRDGAHCATCTAVWHEDAAALDAWDATHKRAPGPSLEDGAQPLPERVACPACNGDAACPGCATCAGRGLIRPCWACGERNRVGESRWCAECEATPFTRDWHLACREYGRGAA